MEEITEAFYLLPIGSDDGEVYLSSNFINFGRDSSCCNVAFPNTVGILSRRHCCVYQNGNKILVEDFSRNGTFINGRCIGKGKKETLRKGDILSLVNPSLPECASFSYLLQISILSNSNNLFLGHYILQEVIATGGSSTVRVGVDYITGENFAIKMINIQKSSLELMQLKENFITEANILSFLSPHPNIARFVDIIDTSPILALIMERGNGDLFDYINERFRSEKYLKEEEVKFLFRHLVEGLRYVHSKGIVHYDLKPENIIFFCNNIVCEETKNNAINLSSFSLTLKLADFGSASYYTTDRKHQISVVGSSNFMAPEIILSGISGLHRDTAADVWSLGAILYFLFFGKAPGRKRVEFGDNISLICRSLICAMLIEDPLSRINLEDVASHTWMKDLDENEINSS